MKLPLLDVESNACYSPHVVILGAGASLAALPHGDRNGLRLPVMNNFVEVVGLDVILNRSGVEYSGRNFEALYEEIASRPELRGVAIEVEEAIRDYFAALRLPDHVTLYDELLLTLREKDVIATFNWDPLLVQAYLRNLSVGKLPNMLFLHGNVAIGTCTIDRMKGNLGQNCLKCGGPFTPTKLLYPVGKKNYTDDPFIKSEWDALLDFLQNGYLLTIFGYSAPVSDLEARQLLQMKWRENASVELAEVFIIDIRPEAELEESWRPFFVRNHYGISPSLDGSWQFRYPRRSCDAFAMATLQISPCRENPLPRFTILRELQEWVRPLVEEEVALESEGRPLRC